MATHTESGIRMKPTKIDKIEFSIEVAVPVRVAYNQWTQFERFPDFMEGVDQVEQVDDTHVHWVAHVGGHRKEWDAEIIEQEPERVISWRSVSGTTNNGSVLFEEKGVDKCRITLLLTYAPEDMLEKVGDVLGMLRVRVAGDLRRFKRFIETRHEATGAWRGEVHDGQKVGRTHGRGRSEPRELGKKLAGKEAPAPRPASKEPFEIPQPYDEFGAPPGF